MPLLIEIKGSELRLSDATNFYNQLYDERLTIKLKEKKLAFASGTTTCPPQFKISILK